MTYWPIVSDRLVALFTAAVPAGVVVWDGEPLNSNGGNRDYVCVGWDEPFANGSVTAEAGSVAFERSPIGNTFLAETGTVTCLVVGQGGKDGKAARDRAFALAQTLAAAVAADHTLTVLPPGSFSSSEIGVQALSGPQGVAQFLTLQVTYTTPF